MWPTLPAKVILLLFSRHPLVVMVQLGHHSGHSLLKIRQQRSSSTLVITQLSASYWLPQKLKSQSEFRTPPSVSVILKVRVPATCNVYFFSIVLLITSAFNTDLLQETISVRKQKKTLSNFVLKAAPGKVRTTFFSSRKYLQLDRSQPVYSIVYHWNFTWYVAVRFSRLVMVLLKRNAASCPITLCCGTSRGGDQNQQTPDSVN